MAVRYSGAIKVSVLYDDRGDYRASVSKNGRTLWRGRVRPPVSGFGAGVSYDSPKAYDGVARAALSFAESDGTDLDAAEHSGSSYAIRRSVATRSPARDVMRRRRR